MNYSIWLVIVCALVGALSLSMAIKRLIGGHFFVFGVYTMLAVWNATCMILEIVRGSM